VAEAPKPAETAAAPVDETNHLENAMAGTKQPEVGAGSGGEGGQGGEKSDAEVSNAILADHALATGRSYEPAK
jgi:hypothetical protein